MLPKWEKECERIILRFYLAKRSSRGAGYSEPYHLSHFAEGVDIHRP